MPICSFRMPSSEEHIFAFFDEENALKKFSVNSYEDVISVMEEHPKIKKYIRESGKEAVYVCGCTARKIDGKVIALTNKAKRELEKAVAALSQGTPRDSFEDALRKYDNTILREVEAPAIELLSSNVKRYWRDERKRAKLHSVFVDLLIDFQPEDIEAFLKETEQEIITLAKEVIRKEGYSNVKPDDLIATRLFAWPGGSVAVNFVPRE